MSGKDPGEERLRQLYESERLTTRQIGKLYDTNKTSVVRWMRRYGIERRTSKSFDEATELAICNRYLKGESPKALGEEFGCNRNTIHAIVKRLGHGRRRDGREPTAAMTPTSTGSTLKRKRTGSGSWPPMEV